MKNYTGKVFNPTTCTLCPWTRELAGFEPTAEEAARLVQPETFDDCMDVFDHYSPDDLYSWYYDIWEGEDNAEIMFAYELPYIIEQATALLIQHSNDDGYEEDGGFRTYWLNASSNFFQLERNLPPDLFALPA